MDEHPELAQLRERLAEEERAYASFLATVDSLAGFPLPFENRPELPQVLEKLNQACATGAPRPEKGGVSGAIQKRAWDAVAPALERQAELNALVVQILNGFVDESAHLYGTLRNLIAAMVRHLQTVLPVMDARDRVATALATTRAELILAAFDKRQEALARRLDGLLALRARVEAAGEEVKALRGALAASAPGPAVAAAAERAADDSTYVAFEGCYRGPREEIRRRLADYVAHFKEPPGPVLDLGCGRGEFLELLREAGIEARGVESNLHVVQEDRARGLPVEHGDLLGFLAAQKDGSCGGVFAAQVAEHLPPAALQRMLKESHRVLRPGGVLLLETVNPRSVVALVEVYNRDLTHERPLHPDTLSFLAAAAGFTEVRVELRSPVDAAARLQPIPTDGLPERVAEALNENVVRLNAFLYGPQDYALVARR
jgi:SAM-dependent methyltransferase